MIEGKRIIVTGGASGMGLSLVGGYVRAGARVVSMDINPDGQAIAEEAGRQGPGSAAFLRCDLANETEVEQAVAAAVERLGGLDILVHAAGICPTTVAEDIELALFERVMAVNMTSTFLLNRAVFPHLKDKGGKIINFASGMGVLGAESKAHYAASKGAVLAWTRSIASAWGRHGITCNAIAPAIWTPMYEQTRATMNAEALARHDAEQARKRPIGGKLGDPERDFLPMMIFLASDGANYLTGQTYKIDGGGLMLS
jgi:NAD(P)-dependent dehydrogenase (short-subunit alcohol dehydrogenase family)